MLEDTLELAENKLLLLYIFNKIKLPVSNIQITQIVLENNLINYFTLQQYITELISSNFLEYTLDEGKQRIVLTEKGNKVLSLFLNRLPNAKLNSIDSYLKKHIEDIKKEITVTADYTIENNNMYIVNLKVTENDFILIDMKINVPSNKQARELCARWKENSSKLFYEVIQVLVND